MHLNRRNLRADAPSIRRRSKERARGGTFRLDDVIRIVAEGLPRREIGELADDAVAFDDHGVTVRVTHDPFAAKNAHNVVGVVVDREMIHKRVRPVRRSRPSGVVGDAVHRDRESWQRIEIHECSLVHTADATSRGLQKAP